MIIVAKTKIDWLSSSSVLSFFVSWHFHFSNLYLFLGRKHKCLHVKSRYNWGQLILQKRHQRLKYHIWWEINTFPTLSSLIGHVLPIFRRRMDGPNPSKMFIKMLILALTSQLKIQLSSLIGKWEKMFKKILKKVEYYGKRENERLNTFTFIWSQINSSVFTLRKWREISKTTSLLIIQASSDYWFLEWFCSHQ